MPSSGAQSGAQMYIHICDVLALILYAHSLSGNFSEDLVCIAHASQKNLLFNNLLFNPFE